MADQMTADLVSALTPGGRGPAVPPVDRPAEAIVVVTGPSGVLRVVLPSFHPDWSFTCRYGRPPDQLAATPPVLIGWPPVGTRCLVALADANNGWVIAFDGWPA